MSFTTFPITVSDDALKNWVRGWLGLLAEGKFDAAAAELFPEVIPNNGSINSVQDPVWTGELIERVIGYGGIPYQVVPDDPRFARVIPIEESFRPNFERHLTIERTPYSLFDKAYLGGIQVDLPLELGTFRGMGDLTARFLLKDLEDEQMAMVLEDIHIL